MPFMKSATKLKAVESMVLRIFLKEFPKTDKSLDKYQILLFAGKGTSEKEDLTVQLSRLVFHQLQYSVSQERMKDYTVDKVGASCNNTPQGHPEQDLFTVLKQCFTVTKHVVRSLSTYSVQPVRCWLHDVMLIGCNLSGTGQLQAEIGSRS